MKIFYTVVGILLITIGAIGLYVTLRHSHTITSIIVDKTDTSAAQVVTDQIMATNEFAQSNWNGITIRILPITAYDLNPVVTIKLPCAYSLLSSPTARGLEIKQFTERVRKAIDSVSREQASHQQSIIYSQVVHELEFLRTQYASSKRLLVFSDLNENSNIFSVYDARAYRQLTENEDSIKQQFIAAHKPSDLHGISLEYIHQVHSPTENDRFLRMANLHKSIFAHAGATVSISASLTQ